MNGFKLTATKGGKAFTLDASDHNADDGWLADLLAAMREGLEANGFECEASAEFRTRVDL